MPATAKKSAPSPFAIAPENLVYVNPDMPGLRRLGRPPDFRYRDPQGKPVRAQAELARIRALAIPPAYEDVWICPLPNGHLQATGRDARGRRQYRYHPAWREMQDAAKFERIEAFGRALPRIRARVQRDLAPASSRRAPTPERTLVLATLVRLLDATRLRVGHESYARENGSYGLSTLRSRHAQVRGPTVRLRFRGKGGVMHESELDDPRVARVVRQCQELPGQELFQYVDERGELHRVQAGDVNAYLREASGGEFSAKDFRTWHGTVLALELTRLACEQLARPGDAPPRRASGATIVAAVARQLGNTPAVCRKAYVHPAVLALGEQLVDEGTALAQLWPQLATTRRPRGLLAAEVRLLQFMRRLRLGAKGRRPALRSGASPVSVPRAPGSRRAPGPRPAPAG
ncbi:DNA topoisomerase IB [Xenophilus sp. Marseille-Q4582]|uniref:DNA topoisomerase IB n=1 Tax=Xenophilus sp. Marseille-Q4582 TaxID=2866600 RepID=UPI001CE3D8F5|nr:DNA topoisomerase IB [Xenophilus sp. Marseille-Q4582]